MGIRTKEFNSNGRQGGGGQSGESSASVGPVGEDKEPGEDKVKAQAKGDGTVAISQEEKVPSVTVAVSNNNNNKGKAIKGKPLTAKQKKGKVLGGGGGGKGANNKDKEGSSIAGKAASPEPQPTPVSASTRSSPNNGKQGKGMAMMASDPGGKEKAGVKGKAVAQVEPVPSTSQSAANANANPGKGKKGGKRNSPGKGKRKKEGSQGEKSGTPDLKESQQEAETAEGEEAVKGESQAATGSTSRALRGANAQPNNTGIRIMMERTNKILERSKKKPVRQKSPVKPRILPARASARLCVRKNSGESENGLCNDRPLRTVELIKRPLELRDPATKILYLASLALYPKADPESDTTPIVIVNEEIPSANGKKPKIRSIELPLLPNWRHISYSSNRSALLEEASLSSGPTGTKRSLANRTEPPAKKKKSNEQQINSEVESIGSPSSDSSNETVKQNGVLRKKNFQSPSSSAKVDNEGQKPTPLSISVPASSSLPSSTAPPETLLLKKVEQVVSKEVPLQGQGSAKKLQISRNVQSSKTPSISGIQGLILNCSIPSGVSIGPVKPPTKSENDKTTAEKATKQTTFTLKSGSSFVFPDSIAVVSSADASYPKESTVLDKKQCKDAEKGAENESMRNLVSNMPVKRKRKSLETIIKEIPRTKAQLESTPSPESSPFNQILEVPTHSNTILEKLVKDCMSGGLRKFNSNSPFNGGALQAAVSPVTSLVSLTVPVPPAPIVGVVPPLAKEKQPEKPKMKKNKEQTFQLPMPLPIPIPPGLLNYASLPSLKNNNLGEVHMPAKPKKSRKPKTPRNIVPPFQRNSDGHASIDNTPSSLPHVNAFYESQGGNNNNRKLVVPTRPLDLEQALDLCVKPSIALHTIRKPRKMKTLAATKSLLKPLNVEEDVPLNLVVSRSAAPAAPVYKSVVEPADTGSNPSPQIPSPKHQGNLENVKQMLARLHTKIAPAVNGVQLITIE